MGAFGCIALLVLPLIGLLLGGWLSGTNGMIAGGGIGLAIALALTAAMTAGLIKARRNR